MKNAKWIVLITAIITIALLACCFLFPFSRSTESDRTHVITVEFNDTFDLSTVENSVREAGASDVLVLKQVTRTGNTSYQDGTSAEIYFRASDDTQAQEIFEKADEIMSRTFAFKYPGELSVLSPAFTTRSVLSLWPVLIVLVVLLAYAFLRFDVQTGLIAAAQLLITGVCTVGVIAVSHIGTSLYMLAALFGTAALSLLFAFLFAFVKRDYAKKMSSGVLQATVKKVNLYVALLSGMAIIGLVLILILGNAELKGFALTALIGTAFCACCAAFFTPALASLTGKAN